jgi:hypothetical protein
MGSGWKGLADELAVARALGACDAVRSPEVTTLGMLMLVAGKLCYTEAHK